ncbi:hypothetical protein [Streptomyces sp. Tue6028]|uniref:hypothetical protein n=1 Tax=Streptomyces sp. Tue6028 TaxID=2036037 RepID=UPI003D704019
MAGEEAWDDGGYDECLRAEREAYAWVMRSHGRMTRSQAGEAALRRYPYEPAGTPCRGLMFHDEAWHWAMLDLEGPQYWVNRPDLLDPPEEYRALG